MIWIIVGYMWLFIHRPFEIWPIFATIRIERLYMIFTLIAWFAISPKTWTSNRCSGAIFLIAFSITISSLFSPYEGLGLGDNFITENWFKIFVFFLLVMTSIRTEKDLKILVTAFVVCFTIYLLHSYREFLCGRHEYRMGTIRMIGVDKTMNDPNSLGSSINYTLAFLLPLLALAKEFKVKKYKRITYLFILGSFGLYVLCVQLTGSRSAFAFLGLSIFGLAMLSKYRVRLLLTLAIAVPIVWFSLPANLQNRFRTLWDHESGPANAQASAESREEFFWIGLELWKKHPLFGQGPGSFQIASGTDMQPHGLIPQVISELGTLGAIAYLSLLGAFFFNQLVALQLYKKMKKLKKENEVLYLYRVSFAVSWAGVLLVGLGFAGHNAYRFNWIWYAAFQALAIGLLKKKVDEIETAQTVVPRPVLPNNPQYVNEPQQPRVNNRQAVP